jgi:hypothetical protein
MVADADAAALANRPCPSQPARDVRSRPHAREVMFCEIHMSWAVVVDCPSRSPSRAGAADPWPRVGGTPAADPGAEGDL